MRSPLPLTAQYAHYITPNLTPAFELDCSFQMLIHDQSGVFFYEAGVDILSPRILDPIPVIDCVAIYMAFSTTSIF